MQVATVKRWHTSAYKLFWRWKSRKNRGRPPIPPDMQNLIRKLSKENPLWGAETIQNTLRNLGYCPPNDDTIRKYMVKPKGPHGKSTTWLPFLRNHLELSWAMDFFTVPTLTFETLYVFVVLDHGRRKILHFSSTLNPTMKWVIEQLREALASNAKPRFLFRDNDKIYGNGVPDFLKARGVEEVRTAFRCPWQNPYCERPIGTLRRELLDHVIVLSKTHLDRLLHEYIEEYYHTSRPHQGLGGDTPTPQEKLPGIGEPSKLISIPVLGGLHHKYVRVSA